MGGVLHGCFVDAAGLASPRLATRRPSEPGWGACRPGPAASEALASGPSSGSRPGLETRGPAGIGLGRLPLAPGGVGLGRPYCGPEILGDIALQSGLPKPLLNGSPRPPSLTCKLKRPGDPDGAAIRPLPPNP
jgi:hypothetical protein